MTTVSTKRYSEEWIRKRLLGGEEVRFPKRRPKKDRTIRAEWLREALEAGAKIAVENAVIVGPLDVRYLTVEGEVAIERSVIRDPAVFSYATFRRVVSFSGTTFEGAVTFAAAAFVSDVFFDRARFRADASFHGASIGRSGRLRAATFKGQSDFGRAAIGVNAQFDNATFEGDATFNGATVGQDAFFRRATFKGKADFVGVSIGDQANFKDAAFEGDASFNGARIGGSAFFDPARFGCKADLQGLSIGRAGFFEGVTFLAQADFGRAAIGINAQFDNATFEGDASFNGARIEGSAFFDPATFKGKADFVGVSIGDQAVFRHAIFEGRAAFDTAQIGRWATFEAASFRGARSASFDGVEFRQGASFRQTKFDASVNFRTARFHVEARFDHAALPNGIILDHARFAGDAYFVGTTLGGLTSFRETTFRSVFFIHEGVSAELAAGSTLDLRGCTYQRMQIRDGASRFRWLLPLPQARRHGQIDWQSLLARQESPGAQPYTQLERAFRAAGQHKLADEVYFQRRWWEARTRSFVRDPLGLVLLALVGYGVRRWFLAVWIAIALGIGTLAFHQEAAVQPHEGDVPLAQLPSECPDPDTCRLSGPQAFWFALNTFLPVEIPAGGEWRPSSEGVRGLPDITYASLANILTIFGWVLVPVGIAALTGILRRERERQ